METSKLLANTGADSENVWIEQVPQRYSLPFFIPFFKPSQWANDGHHAYVPVQSRVALANPESCTPNSKTAPTASDPEKPADQQSQSIWDTLFRAIGLRSIPALFMKKQGRQEPKKVAIQHSRLYALLGTFIHVIPVAGVAAIVTLNIKGHLFGFFVVDYLDSASNWIPALQQAAKLHDLLMLASLTSLVFSVMCSELCCHNGLPYGAVFSGFQVSHPSFMWSQETWGFLKSNETAKLRKAKLAFVVFGAGLLGVSVGPASAGLMIPRLKLSDVGSTPFWLNATNSTLLPLTLNDTVVHSSCANISGQPSLNLCPSSGWEALAGFASVSSADGLRGPPGSNWDTFSAEYFINSSSSDNVINLIGSHATRSMYRTADKGFPVMTTQHAALAEALFVISQMWSRITQSSKVAYLAGASSHTLDAWQPYAGVYCTSNHSIDNASDTRPIPFMKDYSDINGSDLMTMDRSGLLETQDIATTPSIVFVDLNDLHWSDSNLGDVTLGAAILESNRSFPTCIVHAGWASAQLNVSTGSIESPSDISTLFSRSVEISPSWADYLNPVTDRSGNRVFGSLSSFFNGDRNQQITQMNPADQNTAENDLSEAYERILAALVTNGLANVGIHSTLQGDLVQAALCAVNIQKDPCDYSKLYSSDPAYFRKPPDAQTQYWNEWQVKHSVQGLAYSSEGIIIRYNILVLLIYAAVVSSYSLYIFARGQSSYPWRSVSELTTLALVSPQPRKDLEEFHSTSTGIYGLGIFEKNVRVVAVDEGKGAEEGTEELQLVFGKEMPLGYKRLVPNEEYGATP